MQKIKGATLMEVLIVLALSGVVLSISGFIYVQSAAFLRASEERRSREVEEALLEATIRRDRFLAREVWEEGEGERFVVGADTIRYLRVGDSVIRKTQGFSTGFSVNTDFEIGKMEKK